MKITGDAEGLVREILEMARRESAEIVAGAEAEAEKILSAAEAESAKTRLELVEEALAGAGRRRALLLASVPAEALRLRLERQEALLDAIKAEALLALPGETAREGKRALLAALAAQAVSRMEGGKFIVTLSEGDKECAPGLAAEIERRAGRGALEIAIEEGPVPGGGVMVRDEEGRQRWDNSCSARLERCWPELRWRLIKPPGEVK